MSTGTHHLKTWPEPFEAVVASDKTFEWRSTASITVICRADTREELEAFVETERVPLYMDDNVDARGDGPLRWHKVFRKGGPLEWFNPPGPLVANGLSFVELPSEDQAVELFRQHRRENIAAIDPVSALRRSDS